MKTFILFFMMFLGVWKMPVGMTQQFVSDKQENFRWKIIGRAFFDAGILTKDSTSTTFQIDDLRFGILLRFLEHWEGKIEFAFESKEVSFKDIYLNYSEGNHQIRLGHYHEPFGNARVGTTNFRFMTNASSDDILGDKRKLGMTYAYNRERWNMIVGLFSDGNIEQSKPLNQGYILAGKWVYRPLYRDLKLLHIGFAPRFRDAISMVRYRGGVSTDLLSQKDNTIIETSVNQVINQWKLDLEIILLYKKWYLQGQYYLSHLNRYGADNYLAKGGYIQAGFMILGYKHNYDPKTGMVLNPAPGSLEVLMRYDGINLNDAGIQGGCFSDVSLGINYFVNKFIAIKFNYTRLMPGKTALGGDDGFDLYQTRMQLSF